MYHCKITDLSVYLIHWGYHSGKETKRWHLNLQYHENNSDKLSDRYIVDNQFIRGVAMFGILSENFHWSQDRFNTVVDFCLSLINFHSCVSPLWNQEQHY